MPDLTVNERLDAIEKSVKVLRAQLTGLESNLKKVSSNTAQVLVGVKASAARLDADLSSLEEMVGDTASVDPQPVRPYRPRTYR